MSDDVTFGGAVCGKFSLIAGTKRLSSCSFTVIGHSCHGLAAALWRQYPRHQSSHAGPLSLPQPKFVEGTTVPANSMMTRAQAG